MFIVNALIFLITLPFRIVGTLIGGTLHITGCLITFLSTALSFFLRIIAVLIDFTGTVWLFLGIMQFCGVNEVENWLIVGICTLIIGGIVSFIAWLGEWFGDKLTEWGDDLFLFSWKMITF